MDEPTGKFLRGEKLDVADYLFLDDVQMTYHIKRWMSDQDKVLSDLSSRFLNRQLFNTARLRNTDPQVVTAIEAETRAAVQAAGLNPDYYVSVERTGLRPYDYYRPDVDHPQTNIMVRLENGEIKELSAISQTVEALVRGSFDTLYLIYPPEVRDRIVELLDRHPH
jgi:HD superfamily phosphohydrolase